MYFYAALGKVIDGKESDVKLLNHSVLFFFFFQIIHLRLVIGALHLVERSSVY